MKEMKKRTAWRKEIILELMKSNVIYGKRPIGELIEDAKKIEAFVFGKK